MTANTQEQHVVGSTPKNKRDSATRWCLLPKVRYINRRKHYRNDKCFELFPLIQRFWGGRIISINLFGYGFSIDFRQNWLDDMICQRRKGEYKWYRCNIPNSGSEGLIMPMKSMTTQNKEQQQ